MRGKVHIFGKSIPMWLVAVGIIVASAGAATGVVLSGSVTGAITLTTSQALLIQQSPGTKITQADKKLVTIEDDGTGFHAAAEVNTGDDFNVKLDLANHSDDELTGELTLIGTDGITLDANAYPGGAMVDDVVQTGPFTWKFRMNADTATSTDMVITVALADDMPPGFYAIDGTLKQVAK